MLMLGCKGLGESRLYVHTILKDSSAEKTIFFYCIQNENF